GSSISIGTGGSIRIGNTLIPGGQTINTENPPVILGGGKTEIITWVSFNFSTSDEPVLPLLQQALAGVEKIVNEMSTI
ncbi:MAG: hypothetical protein Q7U60_01580, partial [Candidatus Methanoperedens sp.]|nr:hypothetical protein [Candidatus Methanoperedens sp.]